MKQHPSYEDLDRYRLDQLCDTDNRAVSNHMLWCARCRRMALDAKELARLIEHLIADTEAVEEYTQTR
jgi:hypothetical protein